jgi:peptide/nickel transport system substrate-binding protein
MKKYLIPLVILLILACVIPVNAAASLAAVIPVAASPGSTPGGALTAALRPAADTPAVTLPAAPQYGGTLRWIEPSAPGSPIGAVWESPFAHSSQQMAFDTLLKEMPDGNLSTWLCSYLVNTNPANPSLTLRLQKGIKFHDGTDFNAQALKWNIQKLIDSHLFASVAYFKSVDIIDDFTLNIPLTAWSNSILTAMARPQHWVVSPASYEKNGIDWIRTHMVGTGPFVQYDYQRDVWLTGARNNNYWVEGTPYLGAIQYLFVIDRLTQEALFKSGGAEVYNTGGNARVASSLAGSGYKVISQMAGAQVLLPDSANQNSPWSNFKVRQAVEYAIDKEAIARTFGYGYWQAAIQAPSPGAPAYVPSIIGRKYDVAKAKQLLAEAGYPNGFKTRIYAQENADMNVLVALQSAFAKVGINAELQIVPAAAMVSLQSSGWLNGLLFIPLGFEGNIVPFMVENFPPLRTGRFKVVANSPGWVELYNAITTTPAPDPSLMRAVTQDVYDFLMWTPIYWYPDLWVTTNKVQDTGLGTRAPGGTTLWDTNEAWLDQGMQTDAPLGLSPRIAGPFGPDQVFNLDIMTNVASTQPVSGVDAYINFDPAKMEVVDADTQKAGVQIIPGTSLDTVIKNSADNTIGLISYSAGKLGEPFPAGPFKVAGIQFRTKNVSDPMSVPVTVSISGNSTTSVVDFGGTPIPGTHYDASVRIYRGADVTFQAVLQGGSRPDSGWIVPLTVKLFSPGAIVPVDVLTAEPVYTFNLTTTKNGSTATAQVTGVTQGIYDISVASPHCLINVKRGVIIGLLSNTVDMGTLLEGNANDDYIINIQDFGILAVAYGKSSGETGYDARADFDRSGNINITDFGLLAINYGKNVPVLVPSWYPAPGESNVPINPVFQWIGVEGAQCYDLQIADNPVFVNPLVAQTGLTTTVWTCTMTLDYSKIYYWRVRAVSAGGTAGNWMASAFTTVSNIN